MKAIIITVLFFLGFNSSQDSNVVFEGEWERESRWTTFEGTWKIVKDGDQFLVQMGANFEAKKAPDLKIYLSKAELSDISGKNATSEGSPVLIAKLTSYKGKASYTIPKEININEFQTIIVHCVEYSKLWGGSALK